MFKASSTIYIWGSISKKSGQGKSIPTPSQLHPICFPIAPQLHPNCSPIAPQLHTNSTPTPSQLHPNSIPTPPQLHFTHAGEKEESRRCLTRSSAFDCRLILSACRSTSARAAVGKVRPTSSAGRATPRRKSARPPLGCGTPRPQKATAPHGRSQVRT